MGQTVELVDRRITSDSVKMKQFQLLSMISTLKAKVKAQAMEKNIDLAEMATKALVEVYGKR